MENKFVITKQEKRGIIFRLYFTVLKLAIFGIAIALLFAYIPQFNRWFFAPESTPETPLCGLFALFLLILPMFLCYAYFRFSPLLGNNGKMNIAVLLAITMGFRTTICFYSQGWKETGLFLAIAFVLFTLAVWTAVFIKKDFSKYKKIFVMLVLVLMIIPLICFMLDYDGLDIALFYAMSVIGCVWVFLDVQDLWFKLEDIPDQWNFDKMYCHMIINLLAGFWLVHIYADFIRIIVKFWVNSYHTSQTRNFQTS